MRTLFAVLCLLVLPALSYGQSAPALKLADLESQGGKPLGKEELRELLPGAKVRSVDKIAIRHWENNPEGKFIASAASGPTNSYRTKGNGEWHLAEDGAYCVHIEWASVKEEWCRYVFKLGDKYYLFRSPTNKAGYAWEIEFGR